MVVSENNSRIFHDFEHEVRSRCGPGGRDFERHFERRSPVPESRARDRRLWPQFLAAGQRTVSRQELPDGGQGHARELLPCSCRSVNQSANQGLGLWSSGSKEIGGNLWWDIAMQLFFDSAWLSDVNIPTLDQRLSWLSSMFLLAESVWYDIVFALIWQSGWDSDARALARGEEGWGKKELLAPNPPGHHQAPPDQRQPRQPDPRALGGDEWHQALQPHPRAHRPVLWQGLGGGGRCWQRDPPHQSGHRAWGSKVGWSI